MSDWLAAFVVTQLIEVPIYLWAMRGARPPLARLPARLGAAVGASAVTHPVVWFAFPWLVAALWPAAWPGEYVAMVAAAETFAIVVEALGLRLLGLRRAWLWSLVANLASTALGLGARALFGWP